jgi:transposase InsO family protein
LRTLTTDELCESGVSVHVKKGDFLTLVGKHMTKSPKKNKAQHIEKDRGELSKKRREDLFQKKRYQIVDLRAEGRSMRDIADYLDMSVGFVCKWCRRLAAQIHDRISANRRGKKRIDYQQESGEGIREAIRSQSRAPKDPCRKITPEHRDAVIDFRKGHFTRYQGPQKIKISLDMDISHQSIYKILKEARLVKGQKRKRRKFKPFRRGSPNDLWQIDYKILEKSSRSRPGLYLLSVKDDFSSAILASEVRTTCTYEDVAEIMEKTIGMFGPPRQILSDHGTQWYAVRGGMSRFDTEFCPKHGIEHIMGAIGKPTTQGKVERWHGTIKAEANLPPKGSSAEEYGKAIQSFVEYHNFERPHHGIGLAIPMLVYLGGLIMSEVVTNLGVHEVS